MCELNCSVLSKLVWRDCLDKTEVLGFDCCTMSVLFECLSAM